MCKKCLSEEVAEKIELVQTIAGDWSDGAFMAYCEEQGVDMADLATYYQTHAKPVVRALAVLLLAVASAHATFTDVRFDGLSDDGRVMSGAFRYDDAATVVWESPTQEVRQGAISNFSLRIDQDPWTCRQTWDVTHSKITDEITFQDAPMTGEAEQGGDFFWSSSQWCLTFLDQAHEIAGRILNVYRNAYFPESESGADVLASSQDAAPTPEPSSWILMLAALTSLALGRKIKKFLT